MKTRYKTIHKRKKNKRKTIRKKNKIEIYKKLILKYIKIDS